MTEEKRYTDFELKNIGESVIKDPELKDQVLSKFNYLVERPNASLCHFSLLHPLRNFFCAHFQITIQQFREQPDYRRKFIAVAISLYNPEFITGYKNQILDGLAHELSGIIGVHREWVSGQGPYVKTVLNKKRNLQAYKEDRDQIEALTELLNKKLSETEATQPKQGKAVEMFTESIAK